jgi:hypothetical protein
MAKSPLDLRRSVACGIRSTVRQTCGSGNASPVHDDSILTGDCSTNVYGYGLFNQFVEIFG